MTSHLLLNRFLFQKRIKPSVKDKSRDQRLRLHPVDVTLAADQLEVIDMSHSWAACLHGNVV